MASSPDLRHVRYVSLSPAPPGRGSSSAPFAFVFCRNVVVGALAGGSAAMHAGHTSGRALVGAAVGGALGGASALVEHARRLGRGRGFAVVPWGLLLDGETEVRAIRWSGVHALDVKYRASRDGSVHARVFVESVAGPLVGFASDAVDFGALAANLSAVTAASSLPLAVDLKGGEGPRDGDPFVERLLDATPRALAHLADELGLEPLSYRARDAGYSAPPGGERRLAAALVEAGRRSPVESNTWALIAAIAGELRVSAFAPQLARLANAPHPGVAAFARAALGRVRRSRGEQNRSDVVRLEDGLHVDDEDREAISWFVQPEELAKLRAWRSAPA